MTEETDRLAAELLRDYRRGRGFVRTVAMIGCGLALGAVILFVASIACLAVVATSVSNGIDSAAKTYTADCPSREATRAAGFYTEPTKAALRVIAACD